jgi:hypothetical protein
MQIKNNQLLTGYFSLSALFDYFRNLENLEQTLT